MRKAKGRGQSCGTACTKALGQWGKMRLKGEHLGGSDVSWRNQGTTVYVYVRAQSCPTLCNPMDCSPPGSFVHGIFQARILASVAMPSSRGSS